MSFDSKVGINQSYTIPLSIERTHKDLINTVNSDVSGTYLNIEQTKKTISSNNNEFICDFVTAEQIDNKSVKDKSNPTMEDMYFLLKTGSTYEYTKIKPFSYDDLSYSEFKSLMNTDIRDEVTSKILNKSIKATRGMIQSRGTNQNAWMAFSFPFGGISKTTPRFYYLSNFIVKPLVMGPDVRLDLLEGIVYIKQSFPDNVEQVFGYFDIEPLKLFKNNYLTVKGKTEESFGRFVQKSAFGDITVKQLNEDTYILTLSYSAFIVSSDPYFIAVDGVNLLSPRYVEKNTPILVEQKFNKERESLLDSYLKLFNGVESEEVGLMTTFIKNDSSINLETFSKINSSSGLFIYKEVAHQCFDTTNATYLPLFNPQDIVREQE